MPSLLYNSHDKAFVLYLGGMNKKGLKSNSLRKSSQMIFVWFVQWNADG